MLEKIQEIISQEFEIDKTEIHPESNLRNDLHIDSLSAVNLSFEIENQFDIKISDEELANLKTVDDIIKLIEKKGIV